MEQQALNTSEGHVSFEESLASAKARSWSRSRLPPQRSGLPLALSCQAVPKFVSRRKGRLSCQQSAPNREKQQMAACHNLGPLQFPAVCLSNLLLARPLPQNQMWRGFLTRKTLSHRCLRDSFVDPRHMVRCQSAAPIIKLDGRAVRRCRINHPKCIEPSQIPDK